MKFLYNVLMMAFVIRMGFLYALLYLLIVTKILTSLNKIEITAAATYRATPFLLKRQRKKSLGHSRRLRIRYRTLRPFLFTSD